MAPLFLIAYLALAYWLGVKGAKARSLWIGPAAVLLAAALPVLLWIAMSAWDAVIFSRPMFDRVSESGRFGFYVGGHLALWATPVWLLAGLAGLYVGKAMRNDS